MFSVKLSLKLGCGLAMANPASIELHQTNSPVHDSPRHHQSTKILSIKILAPPKDKTFAALAEIRSRASTRMKCLLQSAASNTEPVQKDATLHSGTLWSKAHWHGDTFSTTTHCVSRNMPKPPKPFYPRPFCSKTCTNRFAQRRMFPQRKP